MQVLSKAAPKTGAWKQVFYLSVGKWQEGRKPRKGVLMKVIPQQAMRTQPLCKPSEKTWGANHRSVPVGVKEIRGFTLILPILKGPLWE